jgi:hypothetical protein
MTRFLVTLSPRARGLTGSWAKIELTTPIIDILRVVTFGIESASVENVA